MRKILSILMSLVALSSMASCSSDTPSETRESYTNPVLLLALLLSLVEDAGVSPSDITVYDAGRIFPDWMRELCGTGALEGVQFRYRDVGGSNDASADTNAPVLWSQEVSGETNYLPLCVTQADYLINLANLKGHVYGMTLCATTTVNSLKICQGKIALILLGLTGYKSVASSFRHTSSIMSTIGLHFVRMTFCYRSYRFYLF